MICGQRQALGAPSWDDALAIGKGMIAGGTRAITNILEPNSGGQAAAPPPATIIMAPQPAAPPPKDNTMLFVMLGALLLLKDK